MVIKSQHLRKKKKEKGGVKLQFGLERKSFQCRNHNKDGDAHSRSSACVYDVIKQAVSRERTRPLEFSRAFSFSPHEHAVRFCS